MNKMNITRALAEIKLLEKRINKIVEGASFVKVIKRSELKDGEEKKFKNDAKSDLQSINDLIKRLADIRSKIAISNATTNIKVNDTEYTVTEAITRKNNIVVEQNFLEDLKLQFYLGQNDLHEANYQVEQNVQEIIRSKASGDDSKGLSELRELLLKDSKYELLEGVKDLEDYIKTLEEELDNFIFEIDYELSRSNTLTEIET